MWMDKLRYYPTSCALQLLSIEFADDLQSYKWTLNSQTALPSVIMWQSYLSTGHK